MAEVIKALVNYFKLAAVSYVDSTIHLRWEVSRGEFEQPVDSCIQSPTLYKVYIDGEESEWCLVMLPKGEYYAEQGEKGMTKIYLEASVPEGKTYQTFWQFGIETSRGYWPTNFSRKVDGDRKSVAHHNNYRFKGKNSCSGAVFCAADDFAKHFVNEKITLVTSLEVIVEKDDLVFDFIDNIRSMSALDNLKVGDRVFVAGPSFTAGSYAEYIVTHETYVFPLHHKMSFAQGASLGVPFFTAYKALMQGAQAMPGETVLIHGASGAVGTAAVQIARANGLTVVGTAGTKEGMNVVSNCGAHHVYNHNHKNYDKKMVEHLGTGFDIIIEHLANINLSRDLQMVKENARVMVVGCRGSVNINPRQMMMSEATLQGVSLASSSPEDWKKMGAAIVAGIESGWVNPVVNRVYGMEEVQQVHYDIIHSKGAKGKLVLNVAKE